MLDHLREVGEVRSATEIEDHFMRNFGIEGVTAACEYLADQGLVGKAATPVRLTRGATSDVQELAFFHLAGARPAAARRPKVAAARGAARIAGRTARRP